MNELTKFLIKELLDESKTVAIYGGGFKPPTKGHFNVAELALNELPDIDELKIFVGKGVREGITQKESLAVWNIYKKYLLPKVIIEPSPKGEPTMDVIRYAREHPEEKVYWILGARDGDEGDIKDVEQRKNLLKKYPEVTNVEVKVITSTGGVSGTKARQSLKARDKEQFFQFIPDIKEKEQVWDIVSPVVKEEITPDQVKQADTYADKQLAPVDVDLTSKHVFDRLTSRDSDVTLAQLIGFFKRLGQNKKEFFDFFKKYKEIVATDKRTNLNIPFLNMTNKAIAKTIMRKDNFMSSSPKLVFEVSKEITPDDITRILKRTGEEQDLYVKDWDEFTPELCNDGFCDIFAEKFKEEYPGAELWQTSVSTSPWGFGHSWVKYKDKFYDAETPIGVEDWRDLPYIQKLYQVGKSYPEDVKRINEVGEANLKPYKWEEVDMNGWVTYVEFTTESETEYNVDIATVPYFDKDLNNYKALEIEFLAKPKDAQGSSAKIIVNKGELYRVMATITDIIKYYVKKFKAKAISYSPSKKSDEEDFGSQRDNLYRAFISKAIPGVRFEKNSNFITAILPDNTINEEDPKVGTGKKPKGSSRRLYTDEDPKDTVSIKFKTKEDIVDTLNKTSFKAKSHARQSQIINVVHQRVRAAYSKAKNPEVKSRLKRALDYIEKRKEMSKKKTERLRKMKEASDPQAGTALPYGSGFAPVNEGRYDSITRLVVKDIINSWKSQFNGEASELRFEEDYELENSKGQPIDFELLAVLNLKETEDKTYIVDGGANEELDPPYLEVNFQVDPRNLPKMWSTIYSDLIDVVRHEIEHLTQSGVNVISSKEMVDDQSIRQMINWGLLPQAEYFKLEKEVDAMLQGMYLKAKKSKTPFKDVINDYFEKVGLEGEDKQDVLDLWTKRLKALNLPAIQENDTFGLNELAKTFIKETFEKAWNLQEGMLSLSKYMIDNGMNIKPLPKIKVIKDDEENASHLLGKTAYYDPNNKSITLYTMNRHPKDVLRSFAHEMVHHEQNLEGRLNNINTTNTNEDGDLPEIEKEAYEKGNMMLRNWEDSIKNV